MYLYVYIITTMYTIILITFILCIHKDYIKKSISLLRQQQFKTTIQDRKLNVLSYISLFKELYI